MKNWKRPIRKTAPEDISNLVGGHPIVAETVWARGLRDVQAIKGFLDPIYYQAAEPDEMPGLPQAVGRLTKAIKKQERILVWGDFDVDGQTATSLLVSVLRQLKADVGFYIPIREKESHGVYLSKLKELLNRTPKPSVLLTCDTGIAAIEAADYAKSIGVDFIVTDHHEIPEVLPDAAALVNPNFLRNDHPMRTLPGVGVAFELAKELLHTFQDESQTDNLLDLVALGIIADVAKLVGDTRYLAQEGIQLLRDTKRIGIQEILKAANIEPKHLNEEHIGYLIAPRLNAIGRLSDANPIVNLFTTGDHVEARNIVLELERLNRKRQLLTGQVYQAAIHQIEKGRSYLDFPVIVLAQEGWPAGIIGIVASRLVERYGKPAILIAIQPDGIGRGSARSIDGIDITAAIASQKDVLYGFGGHPMAAGFSLEAENIPRFRQGVAHAIDKLNLAEETAISIDYVIEWEHMNLEFVSELERLAPFGAGNPALILASDHLVLSSKRTIGADDEHLLLSFSDERQIEKKVVWWNGAAEWEAMQLEKGKGNLAYIARKSNYRGNEEVGIQFVDFHLDDKRLEISDQKKIVRIVDLRASANPKKDLAELLEIYQEIQIWVEGTDREKLLTLEKQIDYPVRHRMQLVKGNRLIIWTAPPGSMEFQQALEQVSPQEIILFGHYPSENNLQTFIKRLAGLIKFSVLHKAGRVSIRELAALSATTEQAVQAGINLLQAKGVVKMVDQSERFVVFESAKSQHSPDFEGYHRQLENLLHQTRAYRNYFRRVEVDRILTDTVNNHRRK